MSRARDKANSTVSNFASTGIDDNADANAITIDSSENVGIGGSETTVFNGVGGEMRLVVLGNDSTSTITNNTNSAIAIVNTNHTAGNLAGLHFGRADTDYSPNYAGASIVAQFPEAQVTGQYPKGELAFLTSTTTNSAPSEKMRLLSSGGITFNGDTAAANALSDYEEGTWTPTVYGSSTAGSYTYTTTGNSPYANYTKIGRTVTLQVMLNNITQSSAGSGDVFIGGLPFNKMAGSAPFGCVHLNNWNTTGTITGVTVHPTTFANSGDVLQLTLDFDNSSSNSLSLSHLKSGSSDIGFSLVYFTA